MAIWDIKERYELARGSKYLSNVNGSGRILYAYSGASNTGIQSLNITNGGTSTDFGEMTVDRGSSAGMSSTTRGVRANGSGPDSNVMDYVTISTEGNAADFGDSIGGTFFRGGASNSTRGLFAGGDGSPDINVIDYITVASTGDATDFGDLYAYGSYDERQKAAVVSGSTRGVACGGGDNGCDDNCCDDDRDNGIREARLANPWTKTFSTDDLQ